METHSQPETQLYFLSLTTHTRPLFWFLKGRHTPSRSEGETDRIHGRPIKNSSLLFWQIEDTMLRNNKRKGNEPCLKVSLFLMDLMGQQEKAFSKSKLQWAPALSSIKVIDEGRLGINSKHKERKFNQ